MKKLIFTTLLLALSISAHARHGHSEPVFCEWLGETAISIAQNRDNGIEEYDLIGKYLKVKDFMARALTPIRKETLY